MRDIGIDYALTQAYNLRHYFIIDIDGEIRVDNTLDSLKFDDRTGMLPIVINGADFEDGEEFDDEVYHRVVDYLEYINTNGNKNNERVMKRYNTCFRIYKYFKEK